jgi:hypothetical protein
MIPSVLIDFSVWAKLDRYPNDELILLKGHLLLEVMLAEGLRLRTSLTEPQVNNLSFHSRAKALAELDEPMRQAMESVQQLNKLRNMLAHEPFPEKLEVALTAWSERVIAAYAMHKHQRYTRRTTITQAIAALARHVYDLSNGIALPSLACSNTAGLTSCSTGRQPASRAAAC